MFASEDMPAPLKVLIVEDEMLLAMDLEAHLEDLGQDVVGVAASADEAFALAGSGTPDLALVDVNLRDGPTGPHIASELARKHDVLVVFITGSPDQVPPDHAGALGVILKPWDATTITQLVAFLQAYSGTDAEPDTIMPPGLMSMAPTFADTLSDRA